MKIIEVINLNKSFDPGLFKPKNQVLKNVNFSVAQGKTTGFIGINGSGKTTTLKSILGFLFPDSGEILFFGGQKRCNEIFSKIGYLPERPYLPDFLSAEEFLKFHWHLNHGKGDFAENRNRVLRAVNLEGVENKRLRFFSKGMLQRIGMAQALLHQPELLILDEPMSGLDPDGRMIMKDIIKSEQKKGTSIFFSSHLLGDMEELCSNVVVIDAGKILYQGEIAPLVLGVDSEFSIVSINQDKHIAEKVVTQLELQNELTAISNSGRQVIRVTPKQIGIEKAFSKLREGASNQ